MNTSPRSISLLSSLTALLASTSAVALVGSCSATEGGANQGTLVRQESAASATTPGATPVEPGTPGGAAAGAGTPVIDEGIGALPTDPAGTGDVKECASTSQPTQLQGVTLVFGFDVSASMASDDNARMYKWEPVALAAKTFFSNPSDGDVSAQLTFFPSENADTYVQQTTPDPDDSSGGVGTPPPVQPPQQQQPGGNDNQLPCTEEEYAEPDIPLAVLPADIFGTTIDATEPDRLGTPTRWILPAIIDQAISLRETKPSNYAVVLVTDGLPTMCGMNPTPDNIATVANLAATGPENGIPVYVIGVDTPEGSIGAEDDSIANLNQVAEQGGTETAFIIDTGDVDKTVADFLAVVQKIKESTFSCNMPIPTPPNGQTFDATKVNVAFKTDTQTDLVYSPDCSEEWGWHYDNEAAPTTIILCDSACTSVKTYSSTAGSLDIQFGCERRIINR